jgi:hypothetical protein
MVPFTNKIHYHDITKILFDWFYHRCFTPLSTIFQLYRGGQFYWWKKPEYPKEKGRPAAGH